VKLFSNALCGQGVGGFGDDDPEDQVRDGADAGEQGYERGDDADDVDVPTIVLGEAGADSGDHAVVAGARELVGVWVISGLGWRSSGDGGSAGRAEAGGWIDWFAALGTEHVGLRKLLFCHRDDEKWGLERGGFFFVDLGWFRSTVRWRSANNPACAVRLQRMGHPAS
jgi:hypothetical protein